MDDLARDLSAKRVRVGRHPERGHYDFATIAAVLDAGLVCHVGIVSNGQPIVLPTIYARIGDRLYLHGSAVARWTSAATARLCVTVSIVDALVLARSAYQHTLNYRSVVVLGRARIVTGSAEKLSALQAIVEQVCPGRWGDVRHPTEHEMRATSVLAVPIAEASAKIRTGSPVDFESDLTSRVWAGLIPLRIARGAPISDLALAGDIDVPSYVLNYS
jgi:uncharacterized protein